MAVSGTDIIGYAKSFLGVPYLWGGTSPKGFDCSGLVQYVYKHFGVNLPRTSEEQAKVGQSIPINTAAMGPGDLIFSNWAGSGRRLSDVSHVGIYLGGGQLIEAPEPGKGVRTTSFSSSYQAHTIAVRRPTGLNTAGGTTDYSNPLTGIIGTVIPGLGDVTSLLGPLKDIAKGIVDFAGQIVKDFGFLEHFFFALFKPSTYVRAGAGVFGFVFLFAGLFFLIREAH